MINSNSIYILLVCNLFSVILHSQLTEWNLDFESWNSTDTTPDLWHDTIIENRVGLFPPMWHFRPNHIPERMGLGRTTDASEGNFAVTLSGYYQFPEMRIISGVSAEKPGWPIHIKPEKLLGDYKAILLGSNCDSLRLYVDIYLTRYNLTKGNRDTIGNGSIVMKETLTQYEEFEVSINYQGNFEEPDSVIIVLAKERFGFDSPPECLECSHVYFDNLRFNTTTSTQYSQNLRSLVSIFPNPTNDKIQIRSKCDHCYLKISLYNSHGQLINKIAPTKGDVDIDMNDLASGVYILRIEDNKAGSCCTERIIKE